MLNPLSTECPCGPVKLIVSMLCLYALPVASAVGQQPDQEALRLQQQQQHELQQLQRDQRRRQIQRGSSAAQPVTPALPADNLEDERCWPLNGIRVAGVTRFNNTSLNKLIEPYVAPCMGVNRINRLLAGITRLYGDKGYIASRPYLISTPVAGHSLDIHVEEGYLEAIELADQSLALSLRGAFPGMLGEPLNLRDLEQGLDQLNRLSSVDLTADIAPGSAPGASRIILRSRSNAPRWGLGLGVDNLGSAAPGRDRNTISLNLDNPLQLIDSLNLSFSDTLNHGPRYSRSHSLFYSIPYGYWTYSLFASHAEYRSAFKLSNTTLYNSGRTDQVSLRTDRVLWRDQGHQLSANLQLAYKDVDSYLQKVRLGIQSPTLTVAEAGVNLFWLNKAVWNLDVNYARGLTWFGADRDADQLQKNLPRAQFQRYRANLTQWRNGQVQGQPWQWQSQVSMQYSPDTLPALEQLLGTDDSAVRGYRENIASGAIGMAWRNTLRLPLNSDLPFRVTPRLGLDNGWIKREHGASSQRLSSASAGINLHWKNLQLDFDYQRNLNTPAGFTREPEVWLTRLSLQI